MELSQNFSLIWIRDIFVSLKKLTGKRQNPPKQNRFGKNKLALRYIEDAFLKHCRPDAHGSFSQALPPNNLREPEAWYNSNCQWGLESKAKLNGILEHEEISSQVSTLIEKLKELRIIIVGGFGSGSDLLSWMALRQMAMDGTYGLFRILQFANTPRAIKPLGDLRNNELAIAGTGLILRDFLDPFIIHSPEGEKWYMSRGLTNRREAAELFHNFEFKNWLLSIMNMNSDNYADTRIIITTQYDSLDQLKFAVDKRKYGGFKPTKNAMAILNDFTNKHFWNPVDQMNSAMIENATMIVLKAWLSKNGQVPLWLSHQNLQTLTSLVKIGDKHRIASWGRIWLKVLNAQSNTTDFSEVNAATNRYKSEVFEMYKELHANTYLDVGFK